MISEKGLTNQQKMDGVEVVERSGSDGKEL